MKRRSKCTAFLIVALALLLACALLAGCESKVTLKLVTYDGNFTVLEGKAGEIADFPAVTRDGYALEGWYEDESFVGQPVGQAVFEKDKTYYAKWVKTYAVTFELDGGAMETASVFLPEGKGLLAALDGLVPVKGEYRFGGWYINGRALAESDKMPASDIVLTAKYMAEYKINVYLQELNLADYAFEEGYSSGYALIGEEFSPELSVKGFSLSGGAEQSRVIDADSSENVFELRFDRNSYGLWFVSNYPDGSGRSEEELAYTYLYGEEIDFPQSVPFETDGYRFFGWGAYTNSDFDEAIEEENFELAEDTVLYAIWNKGYTDMFSGEDEIYLMRDGTGKAVLCRGGVDIEGSYNEKKDWYQFESPTTGYVLNARINDNGTFVFYANRKGEYFLFEPTGIDRDVTLALDDMNGIELYRTGEGDKQYLEGEYFIDENGYYQALFSDGTGFVFLLGTATEPANGAKTNVFRIRGEEANWGVLPYKAVYYPVVTLDGFGYALVSQQPDSTAYAAYVIDGDVFTLYDTASGSVILTARAGSYGGTMGYEPYVAEFDATFTREDGATLTTDGCSNAVFVKNGDSFVGSYEIKSSLVGGSLIRVVSSSGSVRVFRVFEKQGASGAVLTFEEKHADYAEYLYVSDDGRLDGVPFLVVNGDGTAAMYEQNAQGNTEMTSSGVIQSKDGFYLYTVTEQTADWSVNRFAALLVNFDTHSTSYDVYYVVGSDDGEETTDYSTVYSDGEGAKLTIVSCFAVFEDADGNVVSGVFSQGPDFIRLGNGESYIYFRIDVQNGTFVRLAYEPAVLLMKKNGSTVSSSMLTVNGVKYGDGYEAAFTEKIDGVSVTVYGYYTLETVDTAGAVFGVYTFRSEEKTFKFVVIASSSAVYFHYFELGEVITFGKYDELSDDSQATSLAELQLTDEKDDDGKAILVYVEGENNIKGTFASRETVAFDRFKQTVYTFKATEGDFTFEFTLIDSYFRVCAPDSSFTAADSSTLQLDGATHTARYWDTENEFFGYYVAALNVLDENEKAVAMSINGEERVFDLNGSDNSFSIRGLEEGAYLKVENNIPDGEVIVFDGHGNAMLKKPDDSEIQAVYTFENGLYTIAFDGGEYVGETGLFAADGNVYYAFLFYSDKIAGAYLDCDDLSVVRLDETGNALRYNSDGRSETGRYTVLSDGLFYFESETGSSALYEICADGQVSRSSFSATYYASDFASIVFYSNGVVLFNNASAMFYSYDESSQKIYTYTPSDSSEANAYGFVAEEFDEEDGSITYTDPADNVTRTYMRFDGKYTVLEDGKGGKLEFQSDGGAEFTVDAVYTDSTGKQTQYYYLVYYGDSGVETMLACLATGALNGSVSDYLFTVNYFIEVNLTEKTFAFDSEKYIYGLTAYDYTYVELLTVYGSGLAFLFEGAYGYINVVADVADGKTVYSVSGSFNFIKDADGNPLRFSDGTLSKAGFIDTQVEGFGNLFASEFVAADGKTYHLNFYLAYNRNVQQFVYIIHSCTLAEEIFRSDDGSAVYRETFLYSSAFRFVKGENPLTGEVEYYAKGDEFYPTLSYRGEPVAVYNFEEESETRWIFYSREYAGNAYSDFRYCFEFVSDGEGNVESGVLVRYAERNIASALGDAARVVCDEETGEALEITALIVDDVYFEALSCVDNGDGTFTVVTSEGTYTVTVHKNENGEVERVSIALNND